MPFSKARKLISLPAAATAGWLLLWLTSELIMNRFVSTERSTQQVR